MPTGGLQQVDGEVSALSADFKDKQSGNLRRFGRVF
jgi:hypothetical protein